MPFNLSRCDSKEYYLSEHDPIANQVFRADLTNRKKRDGNEIGLLVDSSLSPLVTEVTPNIGGTAGGTSLTIFGSKFGEDASVISVSVMDVNCDVVSATDDKIICITGPLPKSSEIQTSSSKTEPQAVEPVVIIGNGSGRAGNEKIFQPMILQLCTITSF